LIVLRNTLQDSLSVSNPENYQSYLRIAHKTKIAIITSRLD